jgi:hypothetical protein
LYQVEYHVALFVPLCVYSITFAHVCFGVQAWEAIHKGTGYASIVVGVAAIATGLTVIQPKAGVVVVGLYVRPSLSLVDVLQLEYTVRVWVLNYSNCTPRR